MKSSDFALVLQQQLDVCRQRDQPGLVGMYWRLGKGHRGTLSELAIANLKRKEMISIITSM